MAQLGFKPRFPTSKFSAPPKTSKMAYTSKSCFAFKPLNSNPRLSAGRDQDRVGQGEARPGSSARQSGSGQDGKSGSLRSVESTEVIEGHLTGCVQAGKGSSEKGQLQPGRALLCPLLQSHFWLPVPLCKQGFRLGRLQPWELHRC